MEYMDSPCRRRLPAKYNVGVFSMVSRETNKAMALGVVGRMRVLEVGGAGVEEGEAAGGGGGAACVVEVWEGRGTPLGVVYTMLPLRRVEVAVAAVVEVEAVVVLVLVSRLLAAAPISD
jgi:hypothetical protein